MATSRGISIPDLARMAGCRYHTLRNVVNGNQSATTSLVFRLADALNVRPHLLTYHLEVALQAVTEAERDGHVRPQDAPTTQEETHP